jgi:protein-tyrosine-phosphatase
MTVDSLTQQRDDTTEAEQAGNGEVPDGPTEPQETQPTAEDSAKSKRGRPKGATARKTRTVELTLTVTGTADGEWQAELKHGSKWVARGLDIPAAAVSRAAKELHVDLSGPIDDVINAAREQQQAKVAQLEAELQQAKQALAELEN